MAGILFDTSVYVSVARSGDTEVFSRRWIRLPSNTTLPVWLSAVVLEELYAGSGDSKSTKFFKDLEAGFDKVNRLLVPLKSDWTETGLVLNRIGQKHGFEQIGKSRLTNDTLIALTAARTGMIVFTTNGKDFQRIEEFRRFRWELV